VLVLAGVTVREAEVLFAPLHAPEAVHVLAFVELHVRTLEVPALIDAGEALRLTVGAGVLLDELLELLDELLDELLEPPPLPPPVLTPPPPPPHAASANIKRNRTGRRFMGGLLQKTTVSHCGHPARLSDNGGINKFW
jgi:hypothetical protein